MKKIAIAVLAMAVSAPSFADQQLVDGIIGAVVGGGGARALYKGNDNRKRNMITAAGALGGMWVGSKIGDDSERHHQERLAMQQQGYDQQRYQYENPRYDNRTVSPVTINASGPQPYYGSTYAVSRPSARSARYDAPSIPRDEFRDDGDVDVDVTVNIPQTGYVQYRQPVRRGGECSSYADPDAARACYAGRQEYLRSVYERAARGR